MFVATPLLAWVVFFLCASAIGYAGPILVRNADIVGWRAGLTRSWIGFLLLATATSLPELATGLSAAIVAQAPDIAVGDVFGSCMFNLLMIVLLDVLCREKPLFASVAQGHILTAAFGVVALGFAGAAVLTGRNGQVLSWANVGITTPLLILIYFAAMRSVYRYEAAQTVYWDSVQGYESVRMRTAILRYAWASAVIVVAALFLPVAAVELARQMGWRQAFVGSLFVAAATSLPELVVTVGALRMRALDLAIANLLGSNLFNILILAVDDIAYRPGPLLPAASPAHAVTAFMASVMSGIVIVALLSRPDYRVQGLLGWASLSLLVVYLLGTLSVYLY
ncbi:MAG: sodium:calcium antiporter [Beijerinckiaceae bacterium]